jgi:hypothetical protein
MDEHLRDLEIAASSGDPGAQARYEHAYERIHGKGTYWKYRNLQRAIEAGKERAEIVDEAEALINTLVSNQEPSDQFWVDLHEILESLYDNGELDFFYGYAPGSGDSDAIVFSANWNTETQYNSETGETILIDNSMARLGELLEKLPKVDLPWSDTTSHCDGCMKAISSNPTHWGWTPAYAVLDGSIMCQGCLQEDPVELFEFILRNADTALSPSLNINPSEHGYTQLPINYESGMYPYQNDDPGTVGTNLQQIGIERYFFAIEGTGQFDVDWVVWLENDELLEWLEEAIEENDLDLDLTLESAIQLVIESLP